MNLQQDLTNHIAMQEMPLQKKLVIIGDVFCDIIALDVKLIDSWGTDTLAKEIKVVAGGSALNIALHGANYSALKNNAVAVNFFSSTGADLQGQICRDSLKHVNIDASKVIVDKDYRTGSCIVLSGSNDRSFITDRGCIKDLSVKWFDQNDLIQTGLNHLHIGGYYNCDTLRTEAYELLKNAREVGMTTSLNPQYDASEKWEGIQEICPYLTFFIANESELSCIAKVEESVPLHLKAKILLDWGCSFVVVTLGTLGAVIFHKKEKNEEHSDALQDSSVDTIATDCNNSNDGIDCNDDQDSNIISIRHNSIQVEVVDTTGAGDAFTGGFLIDFLIDNNLSSALQAGCVSGAAAVMHTGGSTYNLETLKYVQSLL